MELSSQWSIAIVVSLLIEYLKRKNWFPWLSDEHTKAWKTFVGAIAAFLTTIGLTWAFEPNETGNYVFTVVLPTLHQLWHFVQQWALQEFSYRVTQKNTADAR